MNSHELMAAKTRYYAWKDYFSQRQQPVVTDLLKDIKLLTGYITTLREEQGKGLPLKRPYLLGGIVLTVFLFGGLLGFLGAIHLAH